MEKLLEIVKKNSDIKSQAEFMYWFLGGGLALSDTMLKYLFLEERSLKMSDKIKAVDHLWNLKPFHKNSEFGNEIRKLYETRFGKSGQAETVEHILTCFLKQYLFGTIEPEKLFREYKSICCQNYIEIDEHNSFFDKAWNKSNIAVVYGKGGMGKTQLVKSYLQNNKSQYKEICVLDECRSIKEALLGIPFCVNSHKEIDDIVNILKEKGNESLLVIDIPRIDSEDIVFIRRHLLGLNLRLIITTHKIISMEGIYQKEFKPLEDQILRRIFDVNMNQKKYEMSNVEFEKLLDIVDRNTLVIALLGKSIGRKEIPVENLINEHEWIWDITKLATVHARAYGFKEAKSPIRHIAAILDKYNITNEEYSELAIWCRNDMTIEGLKNWCRFSGRVSKIIVEAVDCGIIEYVDEDKQEVKMHSLIADAIWKFYPIKFIDYQFNIEKFLDNIKWGSKCKLGYFMIYNSIYNFIQRFNFEIRRKSAKDKTKNAFYLNLHEVIGFSIQSGNYYGAQKLLYYWERLFGAEKYKGDLWKFEIAWANGNEEAIKALGKKYKELLKDKRNIKQEYLMWYNDFLRIIIDWYIRCLRSYIGNKGILLELVKGYIKIVDLYNNHHLYDPYRNYYVIAVWSIFNTLESQDNNIDEYIKMLDNMELPELKIKVKLEMLYWRMMYENMRDSKVTEKINNDFDNLSKEYQGRLWPIDIEILFKEIETLKAIWEQNQEDLCNNIENLYSIFESRVCMKDDTNEMKKIQEYIPMILKQIRNM